MNVLIVCECSGEVRRAFRALGHDAWSCDLKPAEDSSPHHIQGDAIAAIGSRHWDLIIMHPPCTYISVSGIHWNNRGRGWEKTYAALAFIHALVRAAAGTPWALENPISILSTKWREPDQVIQPHEFGADASKATCLWLHKLRPLLITHRDDDFFLPAPPAPRIVDGKKRWANQTDSGQNKLAPGPTRATARARTYAGLASAMAQQWGGRF